MRLHIVDTEYLRGKQYVAKPKGMRWARRRRSRPCLSVRAGRRSNRTARSANQTNPPGSTAGYAGNPLPHESDLLLTYVLLATPVLLLLERN